MPLQASWRAVPAFLPSLRSLSSLAVGVISAAALASVPALAQPDYQLQAKAATVAPADPAIAGALAQVSAARIRQTIEKLVGFGTRATLSSMETDLPPGTGVTAAADWIFAHSDHRAGLRQAVGRSDPASGSPLCELTTALVPKIGPGACRSASNNQKKAAVPGLRMTWRLERM